MPDPREADTQLREAAQYIREANLESRSPTNCRRILQPPLWHQKGSRSHFGLKVLKVSILGIFSKVFKGPSRFDFLSQEGTAQSPNLGCTATSQAPTPRSPAPKLRSPARTPRSPARKLRSPDQITVIACFRRSPDQVRPARFTEIARFCRSPASTPRSPVFHLRSLTHRLRSPTATHQHEVGLKSACGAVLGFGVSMQKPRTVKPGEIDTELRSPSYFAEFAKKMVSKSYFLVWASRKCV